MQELVSFSGLWLRIPGGLKQIDTGYSRAVVGVSRGGAIWKLKRNRRSWRRIPGGLAHVSVGEGGIWGTNRGHNIYYRLGRLFAKGRKFTKLERNNLD